MAEGEYAVIVLGAGASNEYGLPLGGELKTNVCKLLKLKNDRFDPRLIGDDTVLGAFKAYATDVDEKYGPNISMNRLYHASESISSALTQAPSIDQFIYNRSNQTSIRTVGKVAIARTMLEAENRSLLTMYSDKEAYKPRTFNDWRTEETWLPKLFSTLVDGCDGLDALEERLKKIKVISFNYDRVFRHFLYHALDNYWPGNKDRIAQALRDLVVIHPYGSLGPLEWEKREPALPFGHEINGARLAKIATGILTFDESVEQEKRDEARIAIQKSRLIMFLGFGYHKQNMDYLSSKILGHCSVFGTAMGFSEFDRTMITGEISTQFGMSISSVYLFPGSSANIFSEYSRALKLVGI